MSLLSTSLLCLIFTIIFHSQSHLSTSQQCHPFESSALLHLKTSLHFNPNPFCNSTDPISSWNHSSDCCTWKGITCDTLTWHVIGLNLRCAGLGGSISSNSSLFLLRHLRWLDLSRNNFDDNEVVPQFGEFKNMTRLDLSRSSFKIGTAAFEALVQNSTRIRELDLSGNDLSLVSSVRLMNLSSSLTSLGLGSCNLYGQLPENIFRLPNLRELSLSFNYELNGTFPSSNWSNISLRKLDLSNTGLLIHLPRLVKAARFLSELSLSYCHFVGPVFFGNLSLVSLDLMSSSLTGEFPWSSLNFNQLHYLDLSNNNFTGQLPEFYTQNSSLSFTRIDLAGNSFDGTIPSWIYKLPDLEWLDLSNNFFTGEIDVFHSTSLSFLNLGNNKLQGQIQPSFFQNITQLTFLDLSSNSLTGEVEFKELSKLRNLSFLDLSPNNNISLRIENSTSCAFPNLYLLDLSSCNIRTEFPNFLKCSNRADSIDLSNNKIHGIVPSWFWDMGKDSLRFLNLSYNSLTDMEPRPWERLRLFDIRSNNFSGPIPIISSPFMQIFFASKNQIWGEIPISFCNMTFLRFLDLSYNNISGKVPSCLGNSSDSLSVLDLRSNRLNGNLSLTFTEHNAMRSLNLNGNQLEGPLPKSLVFCMLLEVLDLGNNFFSGPFPIWLESIPNLQVLVLRSNKFSGSIENSKRYPSFYALKIMDLSGNEFSGALPIKLFENFVAMTDPKNVLMGYIGEYYYQDSVMITMKGFEVEMVKIQKLFTTIDVSRNNFTGHIPSMIGRLKSLKGLNFSHNNFTGLIPTSFGNLSNLEWLDLSSNTLVGKIPPQLAEDLYQLSFINVSNNKLEGLIPRGPQFNTFNNDSYIGNTGLCGFPLSKSCGEVAKEYERYRDDDDEDNNNGLSFDWKIVAMGYASGAVIGVSLGYIFLSNGRYDDWLVKRFGKQQRKGNACFRI